MVSIYDIVPGMKVRLVSQHVDTFQRKRKWLGKVVTVRNVCLNGVKWSDGFGDHVSPPCFNVIEDRERFPWGTGWMWYEDHIECIVEDPESQPIDTSAFDALLI